MTVQREVASPDIVVTLVHGTFARNEQWTDNQSDFSKSIIRALPGKVQLNRFQWSGGNSHLARLRAGEGLATFLCDLISKYPAATHHVIAHSHGGNVVMYALRDQSVADCITSLVCLATPFVNLQPRLLDPSVSMLREFPNPLFACILGAFLSFAFGTVGTSPWVIPALLVIGVVYFLVRKFIIFLANRLTLKLQQSQNRLMSHFTLPNVKHTPVFVVQAQRDEAAGYLKFIDWVANLPYRLWKPLFIFWFAWGGVFIIFPWILAMIHLSTFGPTAFELGSSLEGALFNAFATGFVALCFAVVLMVLFTLFAQLTLAVWAKIFRGHLLGFGERNIIENWLIHITASAVPPNVDNMTAQSFVVSGPGLRHSVHRDDTVRKHVAEWLTKVSQDALCKSQGEKI